MSKHFLALINVPYGVAAAVRPMEILTFLDFFKWPVGPLLPAQVANPAPPQQPEVSFEENYHITYEAWQFNIFGTRHEQMIHYRLL